MTLRRAACSATWLRWKLMSDRNACRAFKARDDGDTTWSGAAVHIEPPCMYMPGAGGPECDGELHAPLNLGGDVPAVADFFVLEALEELAYVMGAHRDLLAAALPELSAHRDRLRTRSAIDPTRAPARPERFTACPEEPQILAELESYPWQALCAAV